MGPESEPSGTAMLGRIMEELVQALKIPSPFKNQFNIEENTWSSYQILS
jgi:hypothetical protein